MRKLLALMLLLTTLACQSESEKGMKVVELITPTGEAIKTKIAFTMDDQEQGLSGVKPEDFGNNDGMLFYYLEDDEKNFWMPDTYFDLDLFYLDQNLKVIDIVRKLPHYIGRANENLIPRARAVWCRHTLEMKAGSPIAAKINVGDVLKWKYKQTQAEAEKDFRSQLSSAPSH